VSQLNDTTNAKDAIVRTLLRRVESVGGDCVESLEVLVRARGSLTINTPEKFGDLESCGFKVRNYRHVGEVFESTLVKATSISKTRRNSAKALKSAYYSTAKCYPRSFPVILAAIINRHWVTRK